jgi:hypothetical protein
MLAAGLPAIFIEECMEQARRIRNSVPMRRNLVNKDGSGPTPWEQITGNLFSRAQCQRICHHAHEIGAPSLIFKASVLGSGLKETKGQWCVYIGMWLDSPVFLNPWTGHRKTSKNYYIHSLRPGENFYSFFGITAPAAPFADGHELPAPEEHESVIAIQGLHELMGKPEPVEDKRLISFKNIQVSGIYVVPKGQGMKYGVGEEGELVPVDEGGGETRALFDLTLDSPPSGPSSQSA